MFKKSIFIYVFPFIHYIGANTPELVSDDGMEIGTYKLTGAVREG